MNFDLQELTDGVHGAHAHAVQACGDLVARVIELASSMQHRHHHFDCTHALLVHADGECRDHRRSR